MIGWEAGVSNLASCFVFLTGSWVWSDGFPLERLSWVSFCLLSFLVPPSFFLVFASLVFLRRWCSSLCLSPFVGAVRLFSFVFVVLLPLVGAYVVGGFPLAWVVMYVAVSVSSLLLRYAPMKARGAPNESPRGAPMCIACLLLLLLVPSSCFLSNMLFMSCLFLLWCTRTPGDGEP